MTRPTRRLEHFPLLAPRRLPTYLVPLLLSTLLGIIAGSAFYWAALDLAWNIFIAGFLWTLIVGVGSLIAQFVCEQVRQGEWRRGLVIACKAMLPPTTLYMLTVTLVTIGIAAERELVPGVLPDKPHMLTIVPLFCLITLVIALLLGSAYVLTSPFRPAEVRR